MLKNSIKKLFGCIQCIRFRIKKGWKKNIYIGVRTKIIGGQYMSIGKNVQIRHDCFLACNCGGLLVIDDGCDIGNRFRCVCGSSIHIGKNCLIGPNVYLCDHDHKYDDINSSVKDQGVISYKELKIGDDCWFETNVVIVGNISIGKHSVVGANSVVTKSLPDYCVAVGSPAKVVKFFDFNQQKWMSYASK